MAVINRITIVFILLLSLACTVIYYPVLFNGFVEYDDPAYVTKNEQVLGGLTVKNVKWAFSPGFEKSHFYSYHPLTWLSHQFDVHVFGLNPFYHHLINLLFHLLNTVLLFYLFFRLTNSNQAAFIGALIFACHPVCVEPVAWISSRKDLLSSFFWLLTIHWYLYISYPTENFKGKLSQSSMSQQEKILHLFSLNNFILIILFLLALMAKSTAIMIPFTLLLLDGFFISDGFSSDQKISSYVVKVKEKLPMLLLSVFWFCLAFWGQYSGGALSSIGSVSIYSRLNNFFHSYFIYLGKFLIPVKLSVLYPWQGTWYFPGFSLFVICLFCALTWLFLRKHKSDPALGFGWLWFLITALPVSGFVQLGGQAYADRFMYVPSCGLALIVAVFCSRVAKFRKCSGKGVLILVLLMISVPILILAYGARQQVYVWKDSETLFKQALSVTTDNFIINNNLAVVYKSKGYHGKALNQLALALKIKPDYYDALINLGNIDESMEGVSKNLINSLYQESIGTVIQYPELSFNYALFQEKQKSYSKAVKYYKVAVRLKKGKSPEALSNLGNIYRMTGKFGKAEKSFQAALRFDNKFKEALFNLALLFHQQGKFTKALVTYRKILAFDPEHLNSLANGGAAAASMKNYEEAVLLYKRALKIDPLNKIVRENLTSALSRKSTIEGADARSDPAPD